MTTMKLVNPNGAIERSVSRTVAPKGDIFDMWRQTSEARMVIQCRVNRQDVTPAEFERCARAAYPVLEL